MSERTQNNEENIENQLENNTIKDENQIEKKSEDNISVEQADIKDVEEERESTNENQIEEKSGDNISVEQTDIIDVEEEKESTNENQIKINIQEIENENTNDVSFQSIKSKAEILYLIYKGETQNIERPINNLGKYQKYINTINECINLGQNIFNNLKKNDDPDFEFWAELCSQIIAIIRKVYEKYEDISSWDTIKRLELAIIITYEIIFNHYYNLYSNDKLQEKDKKLVHHIFSEEGRLAMKCVCNATVTLFNELDENDDGKIDCNEIKSCCCSPSKWCKVLCSLLPKKKNK